MITFSPKSITLNESNPLSVASYNVQVREEDGETVIAGLSQNADPSGETIFDLSSVITVDKVGQVITLFVQEVGPTGATTPFIQCAFPHSVYTVQEIPDGAETTFVNV